MKRIIFFIALTLASWSSKAQQFSVSFGLYTGVTGSYTKDEGIEKDPRYEGRFEAKLAPIGLHIGLDYEGFGLMISPGLINIGQNYYLTNTMGGQDGLRKIDLRYLTVPLSFKVHLVRFTTFKLSAVASFSPSFLVRGSEELSHTATKLQFPQAVYPILPPTYTIEYDGVLAPAVNDYIISEKKDFKSLQLFAGAGFRTDWDPSNHWRISVDLRINYGLLEPRTSQFTTEQQSTLRLYEIAGKRTEMFAQFTVGISRYIEFEKNEKEQKKKLKGTTRKYKPTTYPGQRPVKSKPKG